MPGRDVPEDEPAGGLPGMACEPGGGSGIMTCGGGIADSSRILPVLLLVVLRRIVEGAPPSRTEPPPCWPCKRKPPP